MAKRPPKFDRLVEFDERSKAYPVRTLVGGRPRRSYTWRCTTVLDQGREGACVGFAWTQEALATPKPVRGLTAKEAKAHYRRSQELDEFPDGTEGTSVLAGAKVARERGFVLEFRWCLGPGAVAAENDLALAVGYHGPAVLGVAWTEGMVEPDDKGFLHVEGEVLGGHAILCRGYSLRRHAYLLHNSWGPDWGLNGTAWVTELDMQRLLAMDGEAAIPVVRRLPVA